MGWWEYTQKAAEFHQKQKGWHVLNKQHTSHLYEHVSIAINIIYN